MDTVKIAEILQKTLVPFLMTYLPLVVSVLVAWFVNKLHCNNEGVRAVHHQNKLLIENPEQKPSFASVTKSVKKKQSSDKWSGRGRVSSEGRDWLYSRPHSSSLLSIDHILSSTPRNTFLTTCPDDDPDGTSTSSSSSDNKENSSPGRLSRRQKKNRIRKEDSSPLKRKVRRDFKKKWNEEPCALKQYLKLNLSDPQVFYILKNYVLSPEDMMALGYPVESKLYPGRAMIFRTGSLDANAKEFVPRNESVHASLLVQKSEQFNKRNENHLKRNQGVTSEEKKCVRCSKSFFISSDGEYLTQEHCNYHWGKLQNPPSGGPECTYSCCKARPGTKGCSTAKLHVWSGVEPGRNGPYDGYVRTRLRKTPPIDGNHGIYAIDGEMCFTNTGLELTKITVVGLDGKPVYESFVKPESYIIDYNTRFSGITAKDIAKSNKVKSLKDVQNDLMGFITAETILVGHGLENDLRALKMIHSSVVDTAIVFPHVLGLPYKRSLKSLVQTYLRKEIQVGPHDSYEDAASCLELILWKMRKDLMRNLDV